VLGLCCFVRVGLGEIPGGYSLTQSRDTRQDVDISVDHGDGNPHALLFAGKEKLFLEISVLVCGELGHAQLGTQFWRVCLPVKGLFSGTRFRELLH